MDWIVTIVVQLVIAVVVYLLITKKNSNSCTGSQLKADNNINIELSRIDYTLGAHCGPLTIAIFYIKK